MRILNKSKLFFILLTLVFCCSGPVLAKGSCLRVPIGERDKAYLRIQYLEKLKELGKRVSEAVYRFNKEGLNRPIHILVTGLPASKKTNIIESLIEVLNENRIPAAFIKYDHSGEYRGKETIEMDEKNRDAKVIIIEGTTSIPKDSENIDIYIRTEASDFSRQYWAMEETGGSYEMGQIVAGAIRPANMPRYNNRDPDIIVETDFFDRQFIRSGEMTSHIRTGYIESQTSL